MVVVVDKEEQEEEEEVEEQNEKEAEEKDEEEEEEDEEEEKEKEEEYRNKKKNNSKKRKKEKEKEKQEKVKEKTHNLTYNLIDSPVGHSIKGISLIIVLKRLRDFLCRKRYTLPLGSSVIFTVAVHRAKAYLYVGSSFNGSLNRCFLANDCKQPSIIFMKSRNSLKIKK